MKLYYSPGACSRAPHIVLNELGLNYEAKPLDMLKGETKSPDYLNINPLGVVPALVLDDGSALTEVQTIIQYLADKKPEAGLVPMHGTMERVRLWEWLSFISSEVHKSAGLLFAAGRLLEEKNAQDELKARGLKALESKLKVADQKLSGKEWCLGDNYSVADVYLFVVTSWLPYFKSDINQWPNLARVMKKVSERPAVQKVIQIESGGK